MENWISASEAAELFGITRKTVYRSVKRMTADKTKIERGIRYLDRKALRDTIRTGGKGHKGDKVPKQSQSLTHDTMGHPAKELPPPEATHDELKEALFNRLDDLKQALEHERAIARQLSQQNAQLLEQNQRLLEQVDDLTALTIRLGMNRKAPEQISVSDT